MAKESDLTQKVDFDFSEIFQFCVPIHSRNRLCILDRTPSRGQYDFHLDLEHKDASKDHKLQLGESGQKIIFVNRDRAFVLRTTFRLPLTPLNLYIRIIPLYTCAARRNERVCRCLNHSKGDGAPQNESFITIQSPLTKYCELDGHLTVLVSLDRQQLALSLANCVVDGRRSESAPSQTSPACSCPMGEVTKNLICRAGCYTSCLGAQACGTLEIVVRLEEFENPDDPSKGIKFYGLDRVELRCSSTPSRDIRLFLEASTSRLTSLHSNASFDPNSDTEGCSLNRKRRISVSAATRKPNRLLTPKESSVDVDYLPTYVDIPTPGGKQRYYVVLTASEEEAKDFRFRADSRAAYDGTRMSSSAFQTNRDACRKAEAFLAAVYQSSLGNSQPN